jgi:hypothetical protein
MNFLAICSAATFLAADLAAGAATIREVLLPELSQPWEEAVQIVGGSWCNDFCLTEDKLGSWHCIGIGGQDGCDATLFHAVGEFVRIQTIKWTPADPAVASKIVRTPKQP